MACACAKHYSSTGLILNIDKPGSTVTISHEPFPGFMGAMAMPFDLKGGAQRVALTAGDRVKLRLSVKGGRSWVDRLDVISAAPVDAGLEQTPVTHVLVPVGATLPDFELTNQTGAPLALSALKGKVVAVTFIYSRCPLPDYCPRMVENFRAIRDRFADRMARDLVLLTISFDPIHDTPEVLASYASQWDANPDTWRFLTGPPADVERACRLFGVHAFSNEGLLDHSLHTVIINREGYLVANIEGNQFTATQLGDVTAGVLKSGSGK